MAYGAGSWAGAGEAEASGRPGTAAAMPRTPRTPRTPLSAPGTRPTTSFSAKRSGLGRAQTAQTAPAPGTRNFMDLQPAAPLRHPVLRQDVVARFMRKLGVEQTSLGRSPELEEARIQQFIRKRFPFHFTPQTIQRMFHEADSKGWGVLKPVQIATAITGLHKYRQHNEEWLKLACVVLEVQEEELFVPAKGARKPPARFSRGTYKPRGEWLKLITYGDNLRGEDRSDTSPVIPPELPMACSGVKSLTQGPKEMEINKRLRAATTEPRCDFETRRFFEQMAGTLNTGAGPLTSLPSIATVHSYRTVGSERMRMPRSPPKYSRPTTPLDSLKDRVIRGRQGTPRERGFQTAHLTKRLTPADKDLFFGDFRQSHRVQIEVF